MYVIVRTDKKTGETQYLNASVLKVHTEFRPDMAYPLIFRDDDQAA